MKILKQEMYELAGELRKIYQKKINNTHIWASIAYEAINVASANVEILSSSTFKVPSRSVSKTKEISRSKESLEEVLNAAADIDFNYSIFTFIVAQIEAFLSDLVRGVLRIDKRRLKIRVQGIDHTNKIDIAEIIDSNDIDEVLELIIKKELISIFYASPEKQFEYLEKVLNIKIDEKLFELFDKWKEYKATRDIIIHNSGIANEVYLKKSGNKAKWTEGEKVVIEQDYLNSLVAESKSLVGKICSAIQAKNKIKK
ncbi:MAG: hypothetical protein M0P91_11295 [Sulfuricurvum sp.]|jgi:hypothetical protein|uniref:hypothetical protein n=1 Tax=Sulfuricurvum sp. TaxID=2025608 RepID=UPI0025F6F86C|nr:hypothetical protein [Sulfuricurvum sp.]MCK9373776.1 hypothetical protein [Sulfuricurvum sp.]